MGSLFVIEIDVMLKSDGTPSWANSVIDVLSGVFGAACLVASGNPFDTAKVRLQTQPGRYSHSFACIARMVHEEGITSLWKGASPALASAVIENAVVFSANGVLRRLMAASTHSGDEAGITAAEQALIGGAAGVLSSTAICPAEVIKCRMQYQGSSATIAALRAAAPPRLYRSTLHALFTIVRTEGPMALFSGLPALWARDIPFNAVFLGSYRLHCVLLSETVLGAAAPAHDAIPGWMALAAGSLAGATAWGVVYPFDVLKSRAQVAGMAAAQAAAAAGAASSSSPAAASAVPVKLPTGGPAMVPLLASIIREGGLRALYAGASAAIARGAVANGALFWGQNAATKALRAVLPGAAGDV